MEWTIWVWLIWGYWTLKYNVHEPNSTNSAGSFCSETKWQESNWDSVHMHLDYCVTDLRNTWIFPHSSPPCSLWYYMKAVAEWSAVCGERNRWEAPWERLHLLDKRASWFGVRMISHTEREKNLEKQPLCRERLHQRTIPMQRKNQP